MHAGIIGTEKAVEDFLKVFRSNANACVLHADKDLVFFNGRLNNDTAVNGRVIKRIVHQIGQNLRYPRVIGMSQGQFARHNHLCLNLFFLMLNAPFQVVYHLVDDQIDINRP